MAPRMISWPCRAVPMSLALVLLPCAVLSAPVQQGWATMWSTNQALIGAACEYANPPVNSIVDPVLASYLRTGYHCAIGEEFGIGEHCGKCYRLTSLNDNGRHGTPGSTGSAVVMVSNSGAGGTNHFDCIIESFQAITGATSGVFDITYQETACTDVSGLPTIINWADQNAWYCKMMFENLGGWGSLHSVRACLDGSRCSDLSRFSGQTWTGCPTGTGNTMEFTLTQRSPAGELSTIQCVCSVAAWPWETGQRCECPTNFVTGGGDITTMVGTTVSEATTLTTTVSSAVGTTVSEATTLTTTVSSAVGTTVSEARTLTTTVSTSVGNALQSGDTVFLTTFMGKVVDVEGVAVQARWTDRGSWQAMAIEKDGSGNIHSGDVVFLRAHTGAVIDVEGVNVQARWNDKGAWQSLIIEKEGGGAIFANDFVCFRTHTGNYVDAGGQVLQARWRECGTWQRMLVEKEESGAISSGQSVHFVAHTGTLLDVEGDSVQARWQERGSWQTLAISNYGGRGIFSGDVVFLEAHTGRMIDVEAARVKARYVDQGAWQRFVIETVSGGAIFPGDTVFLKAHTSNYLEVNGIAVGANWQERGTWQSFVLERAANRRLEGTDRAVVHGSVPQAVSMGVMLDIVLGLIIFACVSSLYRSSCFGYSPQVHNFHDKLECLDKVHPQMEYDDAN